MVDKKKFDVFFGEIIDDLFRDAWDKCRSMSKEAAMTAYIDEIRKVNFFKKMKRKFLF
jgi:hypothetical protein